MFKAKIFSLISMYTHIFVLQEENRELRRLVNTDYLTRIANRRRFDECLTQEWQRGIRSQKSLSLIMCDVDYFKLYNDTYGHQAGDNCLHQIAQAIRRVLKRPADLVARYGGEEFAVILPETDEKGARQVVEAIRMEIQQLEIPHALSKVSEYVTLSLGVSTMVPSRQVSPLALISEADTELYESKKRRGEAHAQLNRNTSDNQFKKNQYSNTLCSWVKQVLCHSVLLSELYIQFLKHTAQATLSILLIYFVVVIMMQPS